MVILDTSGRSWATCIIYTTVSLGISVVPVFRHELQNPQNFHSWDSLLQVILSNDCDTSDLFNHCNTWLRHSTQCRFLVRHPTTEHRYRQWLKIMIECTTYRHIDNRKKRVNSSGRHTILQQDFIKTAASFRRTWANGHLYYFVRDNRLNLTKTTQRIGS